jgi:hypothetical protein
LRGGNERHRHTPRFGYTYYPVSVTDVTDRAYDTDLLDTLSKRVRVGDGAVGTQLLNETWPDAVETKYVRLQSG